MPAVICFPTYSHFWEKVIVFFSIRKSYYFLENACINTFMTTAVECILEISEDSIIFETRNTKYYLKYDTVPNETEVMCA